MPDAAPSAPPGNPPPPAGVAWAFLRALRPTQWAKNLLLAVPLLAAHKAGEAARGVDLALAFVAFCLTASGIYIVNDLLDRDADRRHPTKRFRPFAAGQLAPAVGLAAATVLISAALTLACLGRLPGRFIALLVLYAALSASYSLVLKRLLLLDVLVLAGLYTLRVLAGGAAAAFEPVRAADFVAGLIPLLYSGIISGGVAFTMQIVAQAYTPPAEAALILSLESVFAAIAGSILLAERLTAAAMAGCALILFSVLMVELGAPLLTRLRGGAARSPAAAPSATPRAQPRLRLP